MKISEPTDAEMKQFQDDLLTAVEDMKAMRAGRANKFIVTAQSDGQANEPRVM